MKVGDRVMVFGITNHPQFNGMDTHVVTGPGGVVKTGANGGQTICGPKCVELDKSDFPPIFNNIVVEHVYVHTDNVRPIQDGDHDGVVQWVDVPWQPSHQRA